jgi:hypothetical protein
VAVRTNVGSTPAVSTNFFAYCKKALFLTPPFFYLNEQTIIDHPWQP